MPIGIVFVQLTHVHSKISYLEVRTSLKSYDEIHDYTIIFLEPMCGETPLHMHIFHKLQCRCHITI